MKNLLIALLLLCNVGVAQNTIDVIQTRDGLGTNFGTHTGRVGPWYIPIAEGNSECYDTARITDNNLFSGGALAYSNLPVADYVVDSYRLELSGQNIFYRKNNRTTSYRAVQNTGQGDFDLSTFDINYRGRTFYPVTGGGSVNPKYALEACPTPPPPPITGEITSIEFQYATNDYMNVVAHYQMDEDDERSYTLDMFVDKINDDGSIGNRVVGRRNIPFRFFSGYSSSHLESIIGNDVSHFGRHRIIVRVRHDGDLIDEETRIVANGPTFELTVTSRSSDSDGFEIILDREVIGAPDNWASSPSALNREYRVDNRVNYYDFPLSRWWAHENAGFGSQTTSIGLRSGAAGDRLNMDIENRNSENAFLEIDFFLPDDWPLRGSNGVGTETTVITYPSLELGPICKNCDGFTFYPSNL